jgi:hypothetical protein
LRAASGKWRFARICLSVTIDIHGRWDFSGLAGAVARLASLGLAAWLLFRWDKTKQQQLSAWRFRRGPNEEAFSL